MRYSWDELRSLWCERCLLDCHVSNYYDNYTSELGFGFGNGRGYAQSGSGEHFGYGFSNGDGYGAAILEDEWYGDAFGDGLAII